MGKRVTERFDRKTFDPVNNPSHGRTLAHLRAFGRFRKDPSTAYWYGVSSHGYKGGHFLDIGCGDSRDYLLAKHNGYAVTRVDLFRPWFGFTERQEHREGFVRADAVEHIPLPDNSVDLAIAQAVYDLIEPDARDQFQAEVYRVLKPGGVFSLYYQKLAAGWGFDVEAEHLRALTLWTPDSLTANRLVVVKPGAGDLGHSDKCPANCQHCHRCGVLITRGRSWARSGGVQVCEKCCRVGIGQDRVGDYLREAIKGL